MTDRPITILVCALGGEGGGVLAEWLYLTAVHAGHAAQSTSIPGVAQRTGATTYYIEVFPQTNAALVGRRPVFGLYPVPGDVDAMIASELVEAGRAVENGLGTPDGPRTKPTHCPPHPEPRQTCGTAQRPADGVPR